MTAQYNSQLKICLFILFIQEKMISKQTNNLFYLNRKSEKPKLTIKELTSKINVGIYEDLIISLLQYCEQLGISRSTTYLSLVYLNIIFKRKDYVALDKLTLLSICCVWIAIKFNENDQTSTRLDLHYMHRTGNGQFSIEDLQSAEIEILKLLQFKLHYTLPHHYIDPFFEVFPWFQSLKEVMPDVIDFAMTMKQVGCESAEDIFYGVFSACLKIKDCTMTPLQQTVLKAQIINLKCVQSISTMIVNEYTKIVDEQGMDEQQTTVQQNL